MNSWSSRAWLLRAAASDCRCASAAKAGERTSGTQIWIGRRPCWRSRARCARTLSRELERLDPTALSERNGLHVTYRASRCAASRRRNEGYRPGFNAQSTLRTGPESEGVHAPPGSRFRHGLAPRRRRPDAARNLPYRSSSTSRRMCASNAVWWILESESPFGTSGRPRSSGPRGTCAAPSSSSRPSRQTAQRTRQAGRTWNPRSQGWSSTTLWCQGALADRFREAMGFRASAGPPSRQGP